MQRIRCLSTLRFITACLCTVPFAGAQTVYYVAPGGDDAQAGSVEAPFQTIGHAMSVLQPGDTCMLREGRYREVIRPQVSGTKEAPILIRAVDGESVVVTGTEKVIDWTAGEQGIWSAPLEEAVLQLFVDGRMQPEACWPNSPEDPMGRIWAVAGEGSGANAIVDANIPPLDLTGAMAHVLPGSHWVSWTLPVDSHDSGIHTLGVSPAWDQSNPYAIKPGTKYYLFGTRSLMDAPGEWWYDAEGKRLYFLPPEGVDPNSLAIAVKRRVLGIDLHDLAYVNVAGIKVFGAGISLVNASNCKISHCHVRYASHFRTADGWSKHNDTGIVVSGNQNSIQHSSVIYSAGNGITLLGVGNSVNDCLVRHVNYMATDCAAIWAEGERQLIRQCSLSDAGRSILIHRYLKESKITLNDMARAGLICDDLGITYCYDTDGAGTEISYNWAHDNKAAHTGVGIYIDNGSSNFLITHNVCWGNSDSGIRLNTPAHNIGVFFNTVMDNGNSLSYWGAEDNKDWAGCRIINNIFGGEVSVGEGAVFENNWTNPRPGVLNLEQRDFRLKDSSRCIDKAIIVDGFPVQYVGTAPDMGAFEFNAPAYIAGHTWGDAPEF